MLVVILVSGIVLAAVMDGLGMFGRLTSSLAGRIVEAGELRDSYYRLEYLATSSDSLTDDEGHITTWRGGDPATVLWQRDSLLLSLHAARTDTLFAQVISFGILPAEIPARPDSLLLVLARPEKPLRIALPVIVPPFVEAQRTVEQTEAEYAYE